MRPFLYLILFSAQLFAADAWFIISGNEKNPYWIKYTQGIKRACDLHKIDCKISYTRSNDPIGQAKKMLKAMSSKPLGISINVPNVQQLSTLLKQANVNQYPLVISSTGLKYYRDLKLKNYVGVNLTLLRAMIREHLRDEDFDNLLISSYAIADKDHDDFINSLHDGNRQAHITHPDDIESSIEKFGDRPLTIITFGGAPSERCYQALKKNPKRQVKWIQIDGVESTRALTWTQISTQPFVQGYRSVMTIIENAKQSDAFAQEVLVKPKTIL
tara:strand:- start:3357 stop:4172 length:816 start_codon:yes stop_codon:yes gene_type:complete